MCVHFTPIELTYNHTLILIQLANMYLPNLLAS